MNYANTITIKTFGANNLKPQTHTNTHNTLVFRRLHSFHDLRAIVYINHYIGPLMVSFYIKEYEKIPVEF